ncbi:hypothetical protein HY339_02915 [Candidatus Gottesmanbacteria bacterium]|nr:hypothetical protein [Candidatus Gottesmanbacteria bacterium]
MLVSLDTHHVLSRPLQAGRPEGDILWYHGFMKAKKANYAFIDSQNLNLGIRSQGWKLDWRKFRQYLVEYLANTNKLLRVLAPNKYYSRLLKPYSRFIVRVDGLRGSLELTKKHVTGIGDRSKP